jgi:hypothetical protein
MTTAVIVSRNPRVTHAELRILRDAGYDVEVCAGPADQPCPVLRSRPCPIVDRADVLVYDAQVLGGPEAARRLIAEVRDVYPDLPLVLTSVAGPIDWATTEGPHRVTPLVGPPAGKALLAAVESALEDQGMAV